MAKVWIHVIVLFASALLSLHAHAPSMAYHNLVQSEKNPFMLILKKLPTYPIYDNIPVPLPTPYDDVTSETYPSKINIRYERIVKELAYMQIFAIGTIGAIAMLPENVSQWTNEDKQFTDAQELLKKHADNIAKGPVWDNDAWAVNYIGHPVAGSYFYVWGRQAGLSWQESAMLTTLMSTFFWEYGWEAFAETPSTQDLIVTPLLGSVLGEGTNYLFNRILENDGKIYDMKWLGDLGRGLLNPIGEMNKYLDSAFEAAHIEISVDYSYAQNIGNYQLHNINNDVGMIQSYFKLNFSLKY